MTCVYICSNMSVNIVSICWMWSYLVHICADDYIWKIKINLMVLSDTNMSEIFQFFTHTHTNTYKFISHNGQFIEQNQSINNSLCSTSHYVKHCLIKMFRISFSIVTHSKSIISIDGIFQVSQKAKQKAHNTQAYNQTKIVLFSIITFTLGLTVHAHVFSIWKGLFMLTLSTKTNLLRIGYMITNPLAIILGFIVL